MIMQWFIRSIMVGIGLLVVGLFGSIAVAQIDVFVPEFETEKQARTYYDLVYQLRCPTCQNQSIADSPGLLSNEIRRLVWQKVMAEEKPSQIIEFLVARYGEFIVYDPSIRAHAILWIAPLFAGIMALIALGIFLRKMYRYRQ